MLRFPRLRTPAALALALAAAACDNPVNPDGHYGHADGLEIRVDGQTIVVVDEGVVDGGLTVAAGSQTPYLEIVFFDHDGDPILADGDTYLEAVVTDESVAEFHQQSPGEFGGRLEGIAAGTTTILFKLMHGTPASGGRPDFTSGLIDIVVTAGGA